MKKKLVNQDPFSNGSEAMYFECQCCGGCVKYSWFDGKRDKFVTENGKTDTILIVTQND